MFFCKTAVTLWLNEPANYFAYGRGGSRIIRRKNMQDKAMAPSVTMATN